MKTMQHAAGSSILRFEGVSKSFAGFQALSGFTMDIRHGEFFGLVGANGAGKTTLIKCLLDFCDVSGGTIDIDGVSHRHTDSRKCIAFLPERFSPPHFLTGRDFLRYMAELHGCLFDEAEARATLTRLDLAHEALDKPARAYSKGMTQKLGLAGCLLSQKPLLLLDEPTSGLDPKARSLLKRELQRAHDAGRTLVLTSHSLPDVEEMCTRMAVMHGGCLRFCGTPAEFLREHHTASMEEAYLACIEEPRVPASLV
jgi:ABC-2 type transport system ATP-binding protein